MLCCPLFIVAQQTGNMRNPFDYSNNRDSMVQIILNQANKWRMDYNSKSKNLISSFKPLDKGVKSVDAEGNIFYENIVYSASFQKVINDLESIDSLLLLSINPTCSEAILFSRQVGQGSKQNGKDQIIYTWKEVDGSWQLINQSEAIKSKAKMYN